MQNVNYLKDWKLKLEKLQTKVNIIILNIRYLNLFSFSFFLSFYK